MNHVVRNKKRLVLSVTAWLLVLFFMGTIFALSAQVRSESAALSRGYLKIINEFFGTNISQNTVRKAAHVFEYFLLAALIFNAASITWQQSRPIFALIFTVLYSVTDEFHQHFVPGRGCRFTDVLVDAAGAAIGILLCLTIVYILSRLKRRKTRCKNTPIK
jgi:VanZ family protein